MLPWRSLCQPKGMGGIGLRNMRLFNISLLGRQVWRLINNKDTLCFKVLSSKYFLNGNIFNAKKVNRVSFTWSSIFVVAEIIKNGFGWQIGDGKCINIWADNWGMEGLNGSTLDSNMLNPSVNSVRDLWIANERRWNIDKHPSEMALIKAAIGVVLLPKLFLHALKDCTTSREVLSIGGWDMSRTVKQYDSCIDWIEDMMRNLDKKAMADLFTTL
ncbi:hypothetical protein PVK06_008487 [Gossypium arboreum]|uniref:Reverse transcriptase n=1 Tax=Gossypium arboreum TaxID=29729 RepID=A0ABR0QL96_GOSAR|nr:hypothetical protein PVK06_008487 [Gossypium arboreum]